MTTVLSPCNAAAIIDTGRLYIGDGNNGDGSYTVSCFRGVDGGVTKVDGRRKCEFAVTVFVALLAVDFKSL